MASSDQLYSIIGKLVRTERERAKLTQDVLAQRVGLTRTSISNIESGRQKFQVHILYAIAEALHVSADTLLPLSGASELEAIEKRLPKELPPAEREWVKRVLISEAGRLRDDLNKENRTNPGINE